MTKPTGKRRGRPKTREYATLMARIPQDLVDEVKRYAGLHRQSISVVIREGLLILLEHDSHGDFMSDRKEEGAHTPIVYDMKEAPANPRPERAEGATEIVSDTNGAATETTSQSSVTLPFDETKYILGKLCPRQHDYDGTRHSLLRLSNRHCLACDREKKFHERKQAKRRAEAEQVSP